MRKPSIEYFLGHFPFKITRLGMEELNAGRIYSVLKQVYIKLRHHLEKSEYFAFSIIFIITLVVYYPGLFQVARADQLAYLGSTATETSFLSLTIGSYALNRLHCAVADAVLFRPIAYFILGLEKYLFGYNFFWWQLTSFFLHICIVFTLFKILQQVHRSKGLLPFLFTLYFSVQYSSIEMVAWHHITSYLFFSMLMLIVIYIIQHYSTYSSRKEVKWILVFCLLLASFTYELGSFLSILTGLYFFLNILMPNYNLPAENESELISFQPKTLSKRFTILFFVIPVVYFLISMTDLYLRFGNFSSYNYIHKKDFVETIRHMVFAICFWIKTSFTPWLLQLNIGSRIEIINVIKSSSSIFTLLFFCPYIILTFATFTKTHIKKKLLFISLLSSLILIYTAIIIVGRAHERGLIRVLYNNSYYSYTLNALFIIFLYSALNIPYLNQKLKDKGQRFYPLVLNAFYLGFVLMIIINASKVYDTNLKMRAWSGPRINLVNKITELVKIHSSEPDFSFSVDKDCHSNNEIPWFDYNVLKDKPLEPTAPGKYTFAQILFPQYYRSTAGKYLVKLKE